MTALAAGRRAEGRRDLRVAIAHGLAAQPLHLAASAGGAAMKRAILLALLLLAAAPGRRRAPTRSATSRSTTSPRCRCRPTASTCATSSTRRRSRRSRSAACPTPRCSRASSAEVRERLVLTVDGRRVPLAAAARPTLSHPPGAGGLRDDAARAAADRDGLGARARGGARRDVPGARRLARGRAAARHGHRGALGRAGGRSRPASLRHYPQDALSSPADVRAATLAVAPGAGTLAAPDGQQRSGERRPGARATCSRARSATPPPARAC